MVVRRGLTLLEVMVALVVLSLIGLSALELVHGSFSLASGTRRWSDAVAYAQDAMEEAKLGGDGPPNGTLPGGYRRQITRDPWGANFELVTVTVFLPPPSNAHFDLRRLTRLAPSQDGSGHLVEVW
jgi:prepilin-type N-terminal cleavage/methylation domain-containing protein